jgi:hypothetical protein
MEALSAADLLDVWEQGSAAGAQQRALLLLGYARPDVPVERLGAVELGARDAELLRLRRATFGERMAAIAACPACGESLEVDVDAAAIQPDAEADAERDAIRLTAGDGAVTIRLPATDDLIAVADAADDSGAAPEVAARRALIARLLVAAPGSADGPPITEELEAAIATALAEAEPALDLELDVSCPACGESWATTIDVPAYLWGEVVASAQRVADDVAGLATAYGWREPDVLALTPWRRRLYLDLAAD